MPRVCLRAPRPMTLSSQSQPSNFANDVTVILPVAIPTPLLANCLLRFCCVQPRSALSVAADRSGDDTRVSKQLASNSKRTAVGSWREKSEHDSEEMPI